ncbi:inorganic pyrophosphatase TTM2 isoform X2 [Juglans microcarpa x Juglans regia]|uniref:inorganic pyrophosphatase TTM2 isoform X2 n=1 Tax=Juglans microcarpa x Juglans regia TaxID=2249226 RepID=UPI001B7E7328|nr:inorganic pyrophosphatase TTM2 isoform X2 [Juglans microcarpa x Juglans regia]
MVQDTSCGDLRQRQPVLLKDQVQLVKRKNCDRYEIASIQDPLSFEKGFFIVIRACQLLAQKNEGIIVVGVAGPSGAGKTVFTEKILNFMPNVAVISMDNYNDSSRIVDGNFDDPRLTDYDTLLQNVHDLKGGKEVQIPIYDFKFSSRTGYRKLEVPSSRIVIIEGIYALSERLRPLLDLCVSVTGGVHFDLVKRVLRDIQRAGQEPEEIIQQISETVYPMYKAFIEPDLQTAHIKIINKFNPFNGFQSPTYILKEWVTDNPFVISPRITFGVSVRLLGGLMALGYTIAAILKRSSHVFSDDRVCVKIDWLEQLNRHYVQVQGKDRLFVKYVAEQLGMEGSYIPRTYIEQIQLEKLVNEVMALPEDLKTKLSLDEDLVSSPKEALPRASADRVALRNKHLKSGMSHSYSTQRDMNLAKRTGYTANSRRFDERNTESPATVANQLSEQISSLNDRMDEFTNCIEELNSKLTIKKSSSSQQNMSIQADACNGFAPTSYFISTLSNGSLTGSVMPNSSSSSQLAKESPLMEEQSSSCNFIKLLGSVPYLEKLTGRIYFTKYLSIGDDRGRLSVTYSHLKIIELYQVSFEDMKEILVVLHLITNSPNLKELQISGSSNTLAAMEATDLDFWDKECPSPCLFERLKVVKMTEMSGVPHEMEFIKFLLERSPVLEVMSIMPCPSVMDGRLNMLIELVRFRRASARAEILFIQC